MPQWKDDLLTRVIRMFGFEHPRTVLLADLIEKCHELQKDEITKLIELIETKHKNGDYID